MSFNWFKKKKPADDIYSATLNLSTPAFVLFVRGLLSESEPGAATMCVVAIQNLGPIIAFLNQLGEKSLPTDTDGILRFLRDTKTDNELSERRLSWFKWALLVKRATDLSEHEPTLHDDIAAIWIRLAEGGKYLKTLLEHNIIWEQSEKDWFAGINSEKKGASYVLNHMSPKWIRDNKQIDEYAEANDFFVFSF